MTTDLLMTALLAFAAGFGCCLSWTRYKAGARARLLRQTERNLRLLSAPAAGTTPEQAAEAARLAAIRDQIKAEAAALT